MSAAARSRAGAAREVVPEGLARVSVRRVIVHSPIVHFPLAPGDRVLVEPGAKVLPGSPLAERTPEDELIEVGPLPGPGPRPAVEAEQAAPASAAEEVVALPLWREPELLPGAAAEATGPGPAQPSGDGTARTGAVAEEAAPAGPSAAETAPTERRLPARPGKWWVGGDERRGQSGRRRGQTRRVGGTLLFALDGRWRAAAGERHEIVESPVAGVVTEARNAIGVAVAVSGDAIPGVVAAGSPSRGHLDMPPLVEGELQARPLDVGRSGAVVVAGSRVSAETMIRARAMSICGIVTGSVGGGELRDLAASEARQRAGLHQAPPFAVLALEGYLRRPIASAVLTLLTALAGREVAIVTDPPLLVFDPANLAVPELPADLVRVRSGPLAGQEGRWVGLAGTLRFQAGVHLEAGLVRLSDDSEPTPVPLNDLERLVF
jgi:hypothetical protein